jgi:hypothetical protein
MKKLFLFLLCALPFCGFSITLQEAIAQNLVKIEESKTSGIGTELDVLVFNQQKKHLRIEIPLGTIFYPNDTTLQPLIITQSDFYTFSPKEKHSFSFKGFCCNAKKINPASGSAYSMSQPSKNSLLNIIKFIAHKNIQDRSEIQNAVWAATNNHRAEAIFNDELKQYVAKELGQTLRSVQIIYDQQTHPGVAAFDNNKLKIKGLFKYSTEKDIIADLCLFDENNKLITKMQSNLHHQRGMHKFGFNFEMTNVKPGRYFVRLVSGKVAINEMEVNL